MSRQRKLARRVRVSSVDFTQIRAGKKCFVVTTTHEFYGGFEDGDVVVVYNTTPEQTCRFRVADHWRFATLEALKEEHSLDQLADGVAADYPESHILIVLRLAPLEPIPALVRDKHPRHHPR